MSEQSEFEGMDTRKRIAVKKLLSDVGRNVLSGSIVAALLALFGLFFADTLFAPPALNGLWKFQITYDHTDREAYQGMRLTYRVTLVQNIAQIEGKGEKHSESIAENQYSYVYEGRGRVPIEIKGYLARKFFSRDKLYVQINEKGTKRESSSFHELTISEDLMTGEFRTTIANSRGRVSWSRQ